MPTDQEAIDAALAYVAREGLVDPGIALATKPEWIRRVDGAVVVGYNSADFARTGDPRTSLLGTSPIRVDEATGACSEITMAEFFELFGDDEEPREDS
ncbi:hypothetical protein [Hamadaea tsunoensis]|uniref:hypothetical protein n=1 Tax=Hamadaea tsunoensis TaxID=53368 RepID=UPI0003FA23D5|nr:hypothetical protein [Hamadaea tsunoensis]